MGKAYTREHAHTHAPSLPLYKKNLAYGAASTMEEKRNDSRSASASLVLLASNKSFNLSLFKYPNHPKKESSQKHQNTRLILKTKCQQNHLGYGSGKNDDSSS